MNSLGSVGRSPDSTCTVNYLHCANTDTEIGIFIPSLFIYPSFWVVVFLDLEVTFHPQTDPRLQGLNGLPNFCCFGIKKSIQLTRKLKTFLKAYTHVFAVRLLVGVEMQAGSPTGRKRISRPLITDSFVPSD